MPRPFPCIIVLDATGAVERCAADRGGALALPSLKGLEAIQRYEESLFHMLLKLMTSYTYANASKMSKFWTLCRNNSFNRPNDCINRGYCAVYSTLGRQGIRNFNSIQNQTSELAKYPSMRSRLLWS